jgi:hypothetical protein
MRIAVIFINENDIFINENTYSQASSCMPQDVYQFALPTRHTVTMFVVGSPLKHPLSYPNCTPSTLTTQLLPLKTRNNHIFGMPAALAALLSTLNYWFRGLK